MRHLTVVTLLICCLFTNVAIAGHDKSNIDYVSVGNVPEDTMEGIKKIVEAHKSRIITNFKVNNMPAVTVKIWQDRNEFELEYGDDAEYVQGYVVQSAWEARFFNGRPELGLGVVHEYTHLVTLALNPSFNNNPRWLWEATAIYESGRPPIPDISSLKCFSEESFPTLESLNQHPFNIYKVGYFLTDFIVSKWGRDGLVKLVESNGDIEMSLKTSVNDFEIMWISFLQDKYEPGYSETSDTDC